MAVVKADGYGHGLLESPAPPSPAARPGWARPRSTRRSPCAGRRSTCRTLAWLWTPGETDTVRAAVAADIDLSVSSTGSSTIVATRSPRAGRTARVHLKIDTGLSRNGAT